MVLVNPRIKAAHDPDCTWLNGASKGTRPIEIDNYLRVPEGVPSPRERTASVAVCRSSHPDATVEPKETQRLVLD
jgi:hypothetical protein